MLIRDYLLDLKQSITTKVAQGREYEEQYEWLQEKRDPNSSLEAEFLSVLYASRRRLPNRAQFRPGKGIYCEADFYYERDGLNGVAVFIDGPSHDDPIEWLATSLRRTGPGAQHLVVRLPGGSALLPLVIGKLLHLGAVIAHDEDLAVGLRRAD
jgi:hypothetical protein